MGESTDSLSWHPQPDDYFYLLGAGVGTSAAELLLNGQGSVGPVVPDFMAMRVKNATLTNRTGTPTLLSIQAYSVVAGLPTPITLRTINLGASATVNLDEANWGDVIPTGYGLQAFVGAGSADVSLLCYQQKG